MVEVGKRGYKPNHKSFGRFILSDQARKPAIEAARRIAARAAETAPKQTGRLAAGYKVNDKTAPVVVGGNPRVGAEVYNSEPHAAAHEFGNARTRKKRILGKAGAAFGEARGEPG